jgi:NAD(P)-dependent dehydrogenase (short-subunit alcohol dehydrogenase family)
MSLFGRLLKSKFGVPADPTTSFKGLNVIVTGANTGLGYEAAIKFAKLGADRVILGIRDASKGKATVAAIEKLTGRHNCLEFWELDMLSYDSVNAFAQRALALNHLDVAVLNAGILNTKFELSKYGWEKTLQVNTLSTFLLASYLLQGMRRSENSANWTPVLEIVSSGLYRLIDQSIFKQDNVLDYANQEQNFKGQGQYAVSKVLLMYATKWLAEHNAQDGVATGSLNNVKVISVCPGACRSQLARSFHWSIQFFAAVFMFMFFRTAEQGARSYVWAITEGINGQFWKDGVNEP